MIQSHRRLLGALSTVITVALVVWFGWLLKQDQGPNLNQKMAFEQHPGAKVPLDAKFRDESGNEVTLAKYLNNGKPVVLMLVFYQCKGTCLLEFEGANKAFRAMSKDDIGKMYDVVTISIHPKETPALAMAKKKETLDTYNRPGAEAGWHFLTGEEAETRKVADVVGFKYYYNPVKDQVVHPTGLILLTPEGRVSRYFMGTEYTQPFLHDSLVAAASNNIGAITEKTFFLGCFQYDEVTGRTRLHVRRAIQLFGAVLLIAMIGSVLVMNKKYRRTRQDGLLRRLNEIAEPKEESTGPDGQA